MLGAWSFSGLKAPQRERDGDPGTDLCASSLCIALICPPSLPVPYRKSKTKPNGKKPPAEEKKQYLEAEFTKVRVVDFDLKELVVLPREIDLNEWLASNTTTFFNLINLQYSTISEFCTGDTCQAMTACNTVESLAWCLSCGCSFSRSDDLITY
ncbi:unnamed protein product [Coregonus sp. 'balchen']|nr:unnamed protein product [Coregonus sp. 'balchen']